MKICILTPRFPFPENGGDVLRINNIARYLKAKGHILVLVSYYEHHPNLTEAHKLYDKIYIVQRSRFASLFFSVLFMLTNRPIQCGYYFSHSFKKLFIKVKKQENPNLYISHLLRMAPYLEKEHLHKNSIIEMTDVLSKTYSLSNVAKTGRLKKLIYKIEKKLILKYEQHIVQTFPKSVLVSADDIKYLRYKSKQTLDTLALYTNGVECFGTPLEKYDIYKICFIGNMRTLQNQDAVIHFIDDILPLIQKQIPEAVFHIVGAQPPVSILKYAARKDIVVTGFVEDLYSAVGDSCIAVAPVQIAAGIQNKVLIAMGMGIPVVMTSLISHAIPELNDGKNCFIRDDNKEFANICVRLMTNGKVRHDMATKGYNMVRQHYSWEEKLKGYETLNC